MSTNNDRVHVGMYLGERSVQINEELIRQYADAVEDHNPAYSSDSPFGPPVAPALILHSEVYRTLDWYLPRIYGNLHARQEWDIFHPVMLGDTVTTRSMVIDRYIKRDREYVVNEVTCYGADGRTLNRGRTHQSFLLDTGAKAVVVDKDREKRADRRFAVGEGTVLEEISGSAKEVTLEMCQRFSGPRKTYHTDVEEARKLGFPDIVVQGMMPLCFVSEMMTARFGAGWFAGGRMNVALVNVLWRGDVVTARGVLRELTAEGSLQRAQLEVWCEKADGTRIVVGTASAINSDGSR